MKRNYDLRRPRWVIVLERAMKQDDVLPGTALAFEHQAGYARAATYVIKRRYVLLFGGRLVASELGRRVYDQKYGPNRLNWTLKGWQDGLLQLKLGRELYVGDGK